MFRLYCTGMQHCQKRVCIMPVQVEEKKVEEPEEKTEDKKKTCDITINFNLNS